MGPILAAAQAAGCALALLLYFSPIYLQCTHIQLQFDDSSGWLHHLSFESFELAWSIERARPVSCERDSILRRQHDVVAALLLPCIREAHLTCQCC